MTGQDAIGAGGSKLMASAFDRWLFVVDLAGTLVFAVEGVLAAVEGDIDMFVSIDAEGFGTPGEHSRRVPCSRFIADLPEPLEVLQWNT